MTSGTPFSRDAKADGIQSTTTSRRRPPINLWRRHIGPPLDRDVRARVL